MKANEKGFTLIELMVVVSIIGTLAAIAIPAYQNYTIRAQISEGLTLAAGPQVAVEEYYSEYGDWPANNADAGLTDGEGIKGKYTSEIFVQDNVVEITYGNDDAHQFIQARKVLLTATDNEGSISWVCLGDGIIKNKHIPPTCRFEEEEEVVEEEKDGKKKKDKKDKK